MNPRYLVIAQDSLGVLIESPFYFKDIADALVYYHLEHGRACVMLDRETGEVQFLNPVGAAP